MTRRALPYAAVQALLAAMGGVAMWRAFVTGTVVTGTVAGLVAGALAAWLLARSWTGPTGVLARALLAAAAIAVGALSLTRDLGAVRDIPSGFATFLTIGLPADGLDHLATIPYVVVAVIVMFATWAALRARPWLGIVIATAGLVAGCLLVVPVGVPRWVAAAFVALLATELVVAARVGRSALVPLEGVIGRDGASARAHRLAVGRRWWRPALGTVVAAAAGAGALALPVPDSFDVRDHISVDVLNLTGDNPLAVAARLNSDSPPDGADDVDVEVAVDGPSPGRSRLAVLDRYVDEGWRQRVAFAPTGTHLARSRVEPAPALATTSRVVISDEPGSTGLLALPTAGAPRTVTDATGLRFDATAGLLLAVGARSDRPAVEYGTESIGAIPSTALVPPGGIDPGLFECPDSDTVRELAATLTAGIDQPFERLRAIESWLKLRRIYVTSALGGQTLAAVERFLEQDFATGNLEVFVTAFALLGRCAGAPVRVVVGYPAAEPDETTRFAPVDVTAWAEMPVADVGWVPVDPIPNEQEQERQAELALAPPPEQGGVTDEAEDEPDEEERDDPITVRPSLRAPDIDWVRLLVVAAVATAAAALVLLALSAIVRRRVVERRARVADPALASVLAWTTVMERFRDLGRPLGPHLTAMETALATAGNAPPAVTQLLGELAGIVDKARFDGEHSSVDDAGLAWALADEALGRLPNGWAVRIAPIRHPRRALSRLGLARGLARRRRRWTGEIPPGAILLDPAAAPVIAGYDVEARIGSGPTSAVYRARHERSGRMVAIKVYAVGRGFDPQRFVWEARVAELVSGRPNLPEVLVTGFTADRQPYLVTKYYQNGTLARRVAVGGPMSPTEVARLGEQLATALDALHEHGIAHGDVTPDNVFIDDDESVVIGDLGSAWLRVGAGPGRGPTTGGVPVLAPAYAAPEVWLGQPPTFASDVYSLGLTLMYAASGSVPQPGAPPDEEAVIAAFGSGIAQPLLEVDHRRRVRSALEVADLFREARAGGTFAGEELPPPTFTVRG